VVEVHLGPLPKLPAQTLGRPIWPCLKTRIVPRAVDPHWDADAQRADQRANEVGDGLLPTGDPRLGDRGGAATPAMRL
jgi:hypothetical protein